MVLSRVEPEPPAFQRVARQAWAIGRVRLAVPVFERARPSVPCHLRAALLYWLQALVSAKTFHLVIRFHLQAAGTIRVAAMFCLAQSARTAQRRGAS